MTSTSPRFRLVALLAAATLFVVGCGDSDDDATTADTQPAEASSPAGSGSQDGDDGGDDTSAGRDEAAGTGFVELDGTRQELTVVRCVEMAGAIAGEARGVDDPDNLRVTFDFSPEDWQERDASEGWEAAGGVTVQTEEPYEQWESGQDNIAGFNLPGGVDGESLDITSIDIDEDAGSAQGEATFIDLTAAMTGEARVADGSFAFTCPED